MNIGIVTTWQERGASYVSRQYRNILSNDYKIFIYARGGEYYAIGDKNWDDKTVTWGKKIPIHMPAAIDLSDFKKWILKNKIEIVLFNEQQWWPPVIMCVKLGIKTGAYIDYYTKETIPLFNIYDFLICNTKRHYNVFKKHTQVAYIPWGTDLNLFKPKNLLSINKNFPIFFHSAGVSPKRKGTDIVLLSFKRLRVKAKLIIHTQTDLKLSFPRLSNLIDNLIAQNLLELHIKTEPAPGLYHLGDIYLYPSRLDGIGLTLSEALACGLPVITCDNQPMNEFINKTNGLLIKIDGLEKRKDNYYWPMCKPNIESLTEKMEYYINNFNKISDYKKQARLYAENNLNWSKNSKILNKLISNYKIIPLNQKKQTISLAEEYEKKRENIQTLIYRHFPFLFKPFSWLWPLIIKRYIKK